MMRTKKSETPERSGWLQPQPDHMPRTGFAARPHRLLLGQETRLLQPLREARIGMRRPDGEHARRAQCVLNAQGFRVTLDERQEKIGHKIRDAQLQKIPFMLIVGDREAQADTVAVRTRSEGDRGTMPLPDLARLMSEVVATRAQKP